MTTVRDILRDSLIEISVQDPREAISADDAARCLRVLNRMVSAWNTEELMTYALDSSDFSLVGGQQDYTYGTGGNFNAARPVKIESVSYLYGTPENELPIEILGDDEWRDVVVKSSAASFPTSVHIHGDYPLNTLSFWPVPSAAGSVRIYHWHVITEFASVNTSVSLPAGYEDALVSNLAVRLASGYGTQASPATLELARASKARIKRMNWQPTYRSVDSVLLRGGNSIGQRSRGLVVD